MMTIHKFPLGLLEGQVVEMNQGAQIKSVQMQGENLCLWALVDTERPKVKRRIYIYGTGHEIFPPHLYAPFIGTVQVEGGARTLPSLVWHLFDGGEAA